MMQELWERRQADISRSFIIRGKREESLSGTVS
jgi:hypothetical protein